MKGQELLNNIFILQLRIGASGINQKAFGRKKPIGVLQEIALKGRDVTHFFRVQESFFKVFLCSLVSLLRDSKIFTQCLLIFNLPSLYLFSAFLLLLTDGLRLF